MSTPTNITDPSTGKQAKVVLGDALAVGPASASESFNATLGVDDVAVEIVPARGKQSFCLTALVLTGNKAIDPNIDAVVDIFEAKHTDPTVATKTIIQVPVSRSGNITLTGILLESEVGHVIMGKTSDDDVLVTLLGFYV